MGLFLSALGALGVLSAFVAFLTITFSYYEAVNEVGREELRRSLGRPTAYALAQAGLMSFAATFLTSLLYPLGWFTGVWFPPATKDQGQDSLNPTPDKKPIVLFVHGLYHNASAWIGWRWYFRRRGYRVFAYSAPPRGVDFYDLLARLAERVALLRHRFPEARIALVGHSLGGLLVRSALSRPDIASELFAVATLAAPHQGSKLAALGLGRLAQSLAFRGELIGDIEAAETPLRLPALSLYTPLDNFVLPPRAGRLPHAAGWREAVTPFACHVSLLYHPGVMSMACAFLNEALAETRTRFRYSPRP